MQAKEAHDRAHAVIPKLDVELKPVFDKIADAADRGEFALLLKESEIPTTAHQQRLQRLGYNVNYSFNGAGELTVSVSWALEF